MSKLEELRFDVYENPKIYKDRTKRCHDKRILNREFKEGQLFFFLTRDLSFSPKNSGLGGSGPLL